MNNPDPKKLQATISKIRNLLHPSASENTPNGHDLLNALHTVLCTIEMLEMDITDPQREVFERLEQSAKHLEENLQAYLRASSDLKRAIITEIDTPTSG